MGKLTLIKESHVPPPGIPPNHPEIVGLGPGLGFQGWITLKNPNPFQNPKNHPNSPGIISKPNFWWEPRADRGF